ncbi:endonuclease/exonuclease/phosphatase family protein [Blastopirellula sp. JC732]|uniref:Endonuclease/exonuclease/phosphatase family protein n=1 Tax=Blastopirellula sediminis TaxID=2894196 RepID=A0A9X1MQX6_9BACT|nr:endonuclease/exonuclease/phosphatase family protein [Blastopirellula sediminis]MCC9606290.1 endonuclease/exonuclease/phosphatase family protein [Blastopirellula sediminis]MCC9630412.1 endonuclease/exonuclease/phosphatase family protein [Blastopirellula sediminis]
MNKASGLVLVAIVCGGGWFFFQNYRVEGLEGLKVVPRNAAASTDGSGGGNALLASNRTVPIARGGETVRIASFNIQVFGRSKMDKPHVVARLAQIVRQYDVVAIEEIRSLDQSILPQFIDQINAAGRHYDYVIGPRLGRTDSKEQYAFIYDTASIEIDRSQLYTIDDPADALHREPLVAWFRVRGPKPDQAFTFTLVAVHTDPDEVASEINVMDDVMRAVRGDGRGEDDVILLGDFNTDERNLGELGSVTGLTPAVTGMMTNTRGTAAYDNLYFTLPATSEFTGRGGVHDFVREFNLSIDEALEISDHLPVWGEFSIYEGGVPGKVATVPSDVR